MKKWTCCFVMFILITSCKRAPEPKVAIGTIATLKAAREIMNAGTCTLVTVNAQAQPYARIMDPLDPDPNFVVWLATNSRSRKVEQIESNPNVALHYVDEMDNGYVTLYGKAELIRDSVEMNNHWKPDWDRFYRNRSTDCVLIKVKPMRLEIIDYKHGISGDPLTWKPTVIILNPL